MYLAYYKLQKKPFNICTDPSFLWLGEKHQEALASLRYGIMDSKGFLSLTGEVGTGKTTLINALMSCLDKNIIAATISDPCLESLDFFRIIARKFHLDDTFATKGDFLPVFKGFLAEVYRNRKKVLLIIDEAQRLSHEMLEEIRLLTGMGVPYFNLLTVFFVGQPEFNNIILEEKNSAIRQRLTLVNNLENLSFEETADYIVHRLNISGLQKKIFDDKAIRQIQLFAGGIPRLINIICDRALLTGMVEGTEKISDNIIRECATELTITSAKRECLHKMQEPYSLPMTEQSQQAASDQEPTETVIESEILAADAMETHGNRSSALVVFLVYGILVALIISISIYFYLS